MKTLIIVLAVLFNSCSSSNNPEFRTINPVLIGKGDLNGNGVENIPRQNIVIDNQSDWRALIQKMDTSNPVSDSFSETAIDFGNFQIIAVFDEIKNSGGHTIDITEIAENDNTIAIRVQQLHTGGAMSVMTQPYHIVKIPKSKKPIVFR